jgi:hypothetical protein
MKIVRASVLITLLLITAHRLSAPIQEIPESPTPRPVATPKVKKSARSKQSDKSFASSENKLTTPAHVSEHHTSFGGTWSGVLKDSWLKHPVNCKIVVSSDERQFSETADGQTAVHQCYRQGDTLRYNQNDGDTISEEILRLTPGGQTLTYEAHVKMRNLFGTSISSTGVLTREIAKK